MRLIVWVFVRLIMDVIHHIDRLSAILSLHCRLNYFGVVADLLFQKPELAAEIVQSIDDLARQDVAFLDAIFCDVLTNGRSAGFKSLQ